MDSWIQNYAKFFIIPRFLLNSLVILLTLMLISGSQVKINSEIKHISLRLRFLWHFCYMTKSSNYESSNCEVVDKLRPSCHFLAGFISNKHWLLYVWPSVPQTLRSERRHVIWQLSTCVQAPSLTLVNVIPFRASLQSKIIKYTVLQHLLSYIHCSCCIIIIIAQWVAIVLNADQIHKT